MLQATMRIINSTSAITNSNANTNTNTKKPDCRNLTPGKKQEASYDNKEAISLVEREVTDGSCDPVNGNRTRPDDILIHVNEDHSTA